MSLSKRKFWYCKICVIFKALFHYEPVEWSTEDKDSECTITQNVKNVPYRGSHVQYLKN